MKNIIILLFCLLGLFPGLVSAALSLSTVSCLGFHNNKVFQTL